MNKLDECDLASMACATIEENLSPNVRVKVNWRSIWQFIHNEIQQAICEEDNEI